VLWCYFEGNDLLDLKAERESPVLMRYLEDGFTQKLGQRQDEIDRALGEFVERVRAWEQARREESGLNRGVGGELVDFSLLPLLRRRLGLQGRETEDQQIAAELKGTEVALFRRVLSEAKASVESWDGTLVFVYLPNWTRYDPYRSGARDPRAAESQRETVLALARDLRLPIVGVVPAFDALRDGMALFPFHAPGHYTEDGHRLVADVLLKSIESGPRP
jgi:hypothetical protein